jgi:hypothetical protein
MKKIVIILSCSIISISAFGQEKDTISYLSFEGYPPLRQLQCGLWINSNGNIAFKEIGFGCELNDKDELIEVDRYLTWTYNIHDTIPNDISEDDFQLKFMPSLEDVVDTASFSILSRYFFMDKNFIYSYTPMACGGHIFVQHDLDKETFSVFKENPEYACDKNSCFVFDRPIEGADPETFRVIRNDEYLISRDKNYFYWNWDRMSDEQVREMEKELGIQLNSQ